MAWNKQARLLKAENMEMQYDFNSNQYVLSFLPNEISVSNGSDNSFATNWQQAIA